MIHTILQPVIALVLWSFVMWAWLYATRLPAMAKLKIKYDPTQPNAVFNDAIPPQARWKADNYNHLMEQPTLFYAIALVLALAQQGEGINLVLAWIYVALRVVHSLVQALVNIINLRFGIFMLGSAVLVWLTVDACIAVF